MSLVLMTYNGFPVYILENKSRPQYKQFILPTGFVISHDPNNPQIFVKTLGSGLFPLSDLRYMNQNDRHLFEEYKELYYQMKLKEVPNNIHLSIEKEN